MAATLTSRSNGFHNYKDAVQAPTNNRARVINCLSWKTFGTIMTMDELSSTLNSAVCSKANTSHMQEHVEKLQKHLLYKAEWILGAHTDQHTDVTVHRASTKPSLRAKRPVTSTTWGGQERHAKFADSMTTSRRYAAGPAHRKKDRVRCGSPLGLKTFKEMTLNIIGEGEYGLLYANSPEQLETTEVSADRPKYKLIYFTSTTTVCMAYMACSDTAPLPFSEDPPGLPIIPAWVKSLLGNSVNSICVGVGGCSSLPTVGGLSIVGLSSCISLHAFERSSKVWRPWLARTSSGYWG